MTEFRFPDLEITLKDSQFLEQI